MDIELQGRIEKALKELSTLTDATFNQEGMDPIQRMMLVTMLHEAQKIRDNIETLPQRVMERFCTHFIPAEKIEAMPAITLVNPMPKNDMELIPLAKGASFVFKSPERKAPVTYIPIFATTLLPHERVVVLPQYRMAREDDLEETMDDESTLWIGIVTKMEVETLKNVSIMIKGTHGVPPERITVGEEGEELDFATFWQMHRLEMLEPFDAQQASPKMFDMLEMWKREILGLEDVTMIYVTDHVNNRDLFKPRRMPHGFSKAGKKEDLDPSTIWLRLQFPKGFVLSNDCKVTVNAVPVANVEVNTLTLTQSQPIAKLVKQDDAFFLDVLQTTAAERKDGYDAVGKEIIIRDFDSASYNNDDLYRDVRNLYNRFVDDYHAFLEYNEVKDGGNIKELREILKKLGQNVGNKNNIFQNGTYVMKNINDQKVSSNIKVGYVTTLGSVGNMPGPGDKMEVHKLSGVNKNVAVLVKAMGGCDKAKPDEKYEMLRYFTLTADRIYTKMDLDAFLRKEIIAKFGKGEFDRIFTKIDVYGTGAMTNVKRAVYIQLDFKDKKNYDRAVSEGFVKHLEQNIEAKACLHMPVFINMVNLEKQS